MLRQNITSSSTNWFGKPSRRGPGTAMFYPEPPTHNERRSYRFAYDAAVPPSAAIAPQFMPDTDNDDTLLGAGADDTAVVPGVHPTQGSPGLAWSSEDKTDEFDQRSWGHTWRNAGIVIGAAAFIATAIGLFGFLTHHSQSAQTSPTAAPRPTAALRSLSLLPPATVTVTAPPPVTITAEAPPDPKLEGVDAKFISFLRNNDVGSVYANVSNATAIASARLICTDMVHGAGFQNVADNLNLTSAQIAWFADTASANYCPQFGGDV